MALPTCCDKSNPESEPNKLPKECRGSFEWMSCFFPTGGAKTLSQKARGGGGGMLIDWSPTPSKNKVNSLKIDRTYLCTYQYSGEGTQTTTAKCFTPKAFIFLQYPNTNVYKISIVQQCTRYANIRLEMDYTTQAPDDEIKNRNVKDHRTTTATAVSTRLWLSQQQNDKAQCSSQPCLEK